MAQTGSYTLTIEGPLVGAAIDVYNESGGLLAAGTLVYIKGYNVAYDCPSVAMSDATDPAKPAMLAIVSPVAGANMGRAQSPVLLLRYDTSTQAVNDVCYLSTTVPGTIQWVKPTAAWHQVQAVGVVKTVANPGEIYFFPSLLAASKLATENLQDAAVTGAKIAAQTITNTNIAPETITAAQAGGGVLQGVRGSVMYSGGATQTICTIPAGSFVVDVMTLCTTAWSGSGPPTVSIGDAGDPDGYLATAKVPLTFNAMGGVNASDRGVYMWDGTNKASIRKYYATNTNIRGTVTNPDTDGVIQVYIFYMAGIVPPA